MTAQFQNFKDTIADLNVYILDRISIIEIRRVQREVAEALKEKLRRQFDDGDEVGMARTIREVARMFLEEAL